MYGGDRVQKNQDEEADIVGADEDLDEVKVGMKRQRDEPEKQIDRR